MADTQINIIKAIHEGIYDSVRGKKLKLNKMQEAILTSNKRVHLFYRGSGRPKQSPPGE